MFSGLRCLSALVALVITFFSVFPSMAMAAIPNAQFTGKVSEIFVNNASVLLAVNGKVNGLCSGAFGAYNVTFDIADPNSQMKFDLVKEAFLQGKTISGRLSEGCGSSNINKLSEVSVF